MEESRKRKRDNDSAAESSDRRPTKVQVQTEGIPAKGGQRRQVRSERKSKKALEAKKNALAKRGKSHAGPTQDVLKDELRDDLATSQDFVSLEVKTKFEKPKEKRRSPRSIRKEQRQKKAELQTNAENLEVDSDVKPSQTGGSGGEARFICFVGNLPYTATSEQISQHFSKLQPKAVRLRTDKKTGKSKGFAFLEFDNYDRMKTCLKLYHHSIFEPEGDAVGNDDQQRFNQNRRSAGRKINVELTAGGGGGKSTGRKDKIRQKNQKLNEERARDWEKKRQEETEKEKKARSNPRVSGANMEITGAAGDNRGDIHPSRLGRVRA